MKRRRATQSGQKLRDLAERWIAAGALIALSPAMAKATSKGPALYSAPRLGKDGKVFLMRKFRSMVADAPEIVSEFKTVVRKADPRLTPIGPILRLGFDELPQLFNIAAGEMSFIGPRPDNDWMAERYTPAIQERLKVKPGIIGLAQILDGRGLPVNMSYLVDAYYVHHRTAVLDALILGLTPLYILGFKQAGSFLLRRILAHPEYRPEHYEPLR